MNVCGCKPKQTLDLLLWMLFCIDSLFHLSNLICINSRSNLISQPHLKTGFKVYSLWDKCKYSKEKGNVQSKKIIIGFMIAYFKPHGSYIRANVFNALLFNSSEGEAQTDPHMVSTVLLFCLPRARRGWGSGCSALKRGGGHSAGGLAASNQAQAVRRGHARSRAHAQSQRGHYLFHLVPSVPHWYQSSQGLYIELCLLPSFSNSVLFPLIKVFFNIYI